MILILHFEPFFQIFLKINRDKKCVAFQFDFLKLLFVEWVGEIKQSGYLKLLFEILCSEHVVTLILLSRRVNKHGNFRSISQRKRLKLPAANHVVDLPIALKWIDCSLSVLSINIKFPISIRGWEIPVKLNLRVVLVTTDLWKQLDWELLTLMLLTS